MHQSPSTIDKNGAKMRSASGRGCRLVPGCEKQALQMPCGCFRAAVWRQLEDTRRPFEPSWGARGPKIQIKIAKINAETMKQYQHMNLVTQNDTNNNANISQNQYDSGRCNTIFSRRA